MSNKNNEFVRATLVLAGEHKMAQADVLTLVQDALNEVVSDKLDDDIISVIDPANESVAFFSMDEDEALTPVAFEVSALLRPEVARFYSDMIRRIQAVKETQRLAFWQQYVGTLVLGTVNRNARGGLIVEIGNETVGMTAADFPPTHQVFAERASYFPGRQMEFLLWGFTQSFPRVPIVSRSDLAFVTQLLTQQVHELQTGDVEIVRAVREPGVRTKIAVAAASPTLKVNPASACIGARGTRIGELRHKLRDSIDIIEWSTDPAVMVIRALAVKELPADAQVEFDPAGDLAIVYVPRELVEKTIGGNGVNARLAAALCGLEQIDVRSTTVEEPAATITEAAPVETADPVPPESDSVALADEGATVTVPSETVESAAPDEDVAAEATSAADASPVV